MGEEKLRLQNRIGNMNFHTLNFVELMKKKETRADSLKKKLLNFNPQNKLINLEVLAKNLKNFHKKHSKKETNK